MAIIFNQDKNIKIEFIFLKNKMLYLEGADDYQKWVPYTFIIEFHNHRYEYLDTSTLNIKEIKRMSKGLLTITKEKKLTPHKKLLPFSHMTLEVDFEIKVEDSGEEDLLSVDLWINMGSLTQGKISGFNVGISTHFNCHDMLIFCNELNKNLNDLGVLL